MSLTAIELKFLLRLLAFEGYRCPISEVVLNNSTSATHRDRICTGLAEKGLVEYDSEVTSFALARPGKVLLTLKTTSLPVTPDELVVLKSCQGTMTPAQLPQKIPTSDRQRLIRTLVERRMLNIKQVTVKTVRLSDYGKHFLLAEYTPVGNTLVATATMLGHYVQFLRKEALQAPGPRLTKAHSSSAVA